MNKLISGFKGFAKKFKNSDSGEGSNLIQTGISLISKIGTLKLILILIPIFAIFVSVVGVTSIFGQELLQVQMSVGSGGGSNMIGKGIYSQADLEDAVSIGDTSIKGGSYEHFVSSLSGTSFNDVNGFNEFIKANVNKAGFGTREGVIAAAMALCYELPKETGSRYFYHYEHGVNPRHGIEGITPDVILDCRSFVQWAVYNGGYKAEELGYIGLGGVAKIASVRTDIRTMQPGDIFSTDYEGHTWLVVAVTEDGYYAAEEFSGAEINYYSFDQPWGTYPGSQGAKLYDMSAYYNNPDNVRSNQ